MLFIRLCVTVLMIILYSKSFLVDIFFLKNERNWDVGLIPKTDVFTENCRNIYSKIWVQYEFYDIILYVYWIENKRSKIKAIFFLIYKNKHFLVHVCFLFIF